MQKTNEDVLNVWLKLSTAICNERMVSDMPYNEALLYNLLYRAQKETPERKLTATDLCNETHMLKSLMNRTLNHMEEKQLIKRVRSEEDRRQVYVVLNPEEVGVYEKQHAKILDFIDRLMEKIGWDHAEEIVNLLSLISETAEEVLG